MDHKQSTTDFVVNINYICVGLCFVSIVNLALAFMGRTSEWKVFVSAVILQYQTILTSINQYLQLLTNITKY